MEKVTVGTLGIGLRYPAEKQMPKLEKKIENPKPRYNATLRYSNPGQNFAREKVLYQCT